VSRNYSTDIFHSEKNLQLHRRC